MAEVKSGDCCLEHKQSTTASSSSVSKSCDTPAPKSPGIGSPTLSSPSHRFYSPFGEINMATPVRFSSVRGVERERKPQKGAAYSRIKSMGDQATASPNTFKPFSAFKRLATSMSGSNNHFCNIDYDDDEDEDVDHVPEMSVKDDGYLDPVAEDPNEFEREKPDSPLHEQPTLPARRKKESRLFGWFRRKRNGLSGNQST